MQKGCGNGVDAASRNRVAWKRKAGERIVDGDQLSSRVCGLGEVARALSGGRHPDAGVSGLHVVVVLGGEPEERAIPGNRTTKRAATQVVGAGRLRQPGFLAEVVVRLSPDGPRLEETRAAEAVRSALQRGIEHAAAGAAHFRVIGVDLDFHVFERFNRRIRARAVSHVGNRYAVQRVVVAAPRPTPEREQRCIGLILLPIELCVPGRDHRGHGRADQECGPAGRRECLKRRRVEHRPLRRVRRLDDRRLASNRDVFLDRTHFHRQVERQELLSADGNLTAIDRLVARENGFDLVRAGLDV